MFTAFEVEQSEPGVLGAEKDKGLDSKFCAIQQIQQNLFQVLQQWLAHLSPTKKARCGLAGAGSLFRSPLGSICI